MIKWGVRFGVVGLAVALLFSSGDFLSGGVALAVLAYLVYRAAPGIGRDIAAAWSFLGRARAPRFSRGGADL